MALPDPRAQRTSVQKRISGRATSLLALATSLSLAAVILVFAPWLPRGSGLAQAGPSEPDIIVIAPRKGASFSLTRSDALRLLKAVRQYLEPPLREEARRAPDEETGEDEELTNEELAEKIAEAFDAAVEKVKADVKRMETCVRKRGLTSTWREITGGDDALPEVRWAYDAHGTVVLDDDGTVERYVTFHNPFHADSTNLRFEVSVHENAHHVYYAREGKDSADHPDRWDDIRVAIKSNARFCRGGG
ncbi:MAG: hypothetical protein OXQ90_17080 [Gammaproteobacteria bacterium]|nr:hypothetical protein [Gammaproteobacteria bacterium]